MAAAHETLSEPEVPAADEPRDAIDSALVARLLLRGPLVSEPPGLSARECMLLSRLVLERYGIVLGEKKRALIQGRLLAILRRHGCESFEEYYRYVRDEPTGTALDELIERVSTNHTSFFRAREQIRCLRQVCLPELVRRFGDGRRELRVWSAGCSTGEEPYTLAMVLLDFFGTRAATWDLGILGTDVSREVLAVAERAEYDAARAEPVPPALRQRYFQPAGAGRLRVTQEVRELVLLRRLNLLRPSYPFRQRFHVLLCCNVMIYFDMDTRLQVLRRFREVIEPGGYLFVGPSESLSDIRHLFRPVTPTVYQRVS